MFRKTARLSTPVDPSHAVSAPLLERRLFVALTISLSLHVAIAFGFHLSPAHPKLTPKLIKASLRSPARLVLPAAQQEAEVAPPNARQAKATPADPHNSGLAPPAKAIIQSAETDAPFAHRSPEKTLSPQAILAAAREMARNQEIAGQHGAAPTGTTWADRPVQAALAKALANESGGTRTTRFADGMIKVTTAAGLTYCLRPPPPSPSGGPAMISVATNCP